MSRRLWQVSTSSSTTRMEVGVLMVHLPACQGPAASSVTVKVLPLPASLVTRSAPWFFSRIGRRVGLQGLLEAPPDGERGPGRDRQAGEVGQGRDDAVGEDDVALDPAEVLVALLGDEVLRVEQVVDGGLDDVERVAQLVGDAA